MIAPSSPRRFASHAHGRAALMAAVVLAGAGCGGGSTTPTPVTTSTPSTSPTTIASTTTTSAPATTTTTTPATTTTSIPALTGSFRVEGTPCVAGASGSVSCRFIASASGGTPPYTFNWRFFNPSNNNSSTPSGQQVDPVLGCDIATGVATFQVSITLTIMDASRASTTVTGSQQIARAAGACGT